VASGEYRVVVRRSAQKELLALPGKISDQVERKIDRLEAHLNAGTRPPDMRRIEGEAHTYRIDTGEYRILFIRNENERLVTITRVRHRRDVYRGIGRAREAGSAASAGFTP
jgi:mRNA interferase RelE/StbE